ncbi:MAG: BCCT family transporter [Pseudomonadota bacterium]
MSDSSSTTILPDLDETPNGDYDTPYEAGQDNIRFWGLDIHNPVFFVSAAFILAFIGFSLGFPDRANPILIGAKDWTIDRFDWLFSISVNIALVFLIGVFLSPAGRIRLGGAEAKPEFGLLSWLAMLFSAGVGIGMVFYGAAEPLAYFTDWYGTPLNAAAGTDEARRLAFTATMLHWGLTPWAVYALIGLSLAYFTFNKGLPLTIRSIFYPLFGEKTWGWPGHVIDILAVTATLFGLATSLGLGAAQATAGIEFLFGIGGGLTSQVVLIGAVTSLAIFSVVRGLDGGVRVLSNINICVAVALLIFVFLAGPTADIAKRSALNIGQYFVDFGRLSIWFGREDEDWFHGWTIFYWAWWISWSPFVGMFIARVSRGRTIRQFLAAVLIVPLLAATIWFTAFGETAISQSEAGVGVLADGVREVPLVMFEMLANLPFPLISSLVAIMLLIVFFVTSSDSGSLVIDSITAGGKLHAPVTQRVFWATTEGLVAATLLIAGGAQALGALQAGVIATGLPFTLVLLACCVSLTRGLISELSG